MAKNTMNMHKMKTAAVEFEKVYASMTNNKEKLDGLVDALPKTWKGEDTDAYLQAYSEHSDDFMLLAESIRNCASELASVTNSFGRSGVSPTSRLAKG